MSDVKGGRLAYLINGEGPVTCILAHGAGAPMDSKWLEDFALNLAMQGIKVVRFEFPYMQERRESGKKRPPNRQPELIECFKQVLDDIDGPWVLAGKSMGGRMASILASELPVGLENEKLREQLKGVLALGYPFHPQGKPEKLRIDHLPLIDVPMAIVQGDRDKLGDRVLVERLGLPSDLQFLWLEDGDHDLKPRVKSGFKHEEHLARAVDYSAQFIKQCFSK